MAFSLFPKEIKFFELFTEQNRKIVEAVALLQEIFSCVEDGSQKCAEIDEIEKEGNFIYRAINRKLSLTFITSIDRNDIRELNLAQEEVLNAMRSVSARMALFDFPTVPDSAQKLLTDIRSLTDETGKMSNCLKMKSEADDEIKAATKIKEEFDQLLLVALKETYLKKNPGQEDLLAIMQWTQIYDRMEEASGRLENLIHVIEGIMLKYV